MAAPASKPATQLNPHGKPEDAAETLNPSKVSSDGDGDQQLELPALRFCLLTLGLCLGLFLSFIDTSIVATSLFSIGSDFDDLESVNWVALAYTLSYLGCAVFFARVSDVLGRRNAFVAAYIGFFAFSIGCGFAQNMNQLIACRALQGIGGSGLYSLTMVILPEVSPAKFRQALGGVIGIVVAVGGVLGPVLGGVLTHYATWRWVFWINGPIGAVSLVLFYFTWPKAEYLPDLQRRKWTELDYFGSVLLVAAAVLVVFSFQNAARVEDGWSQAVFIAPLLVGLASWAALVLWSMFVDRRWGDKLAAAFPMRLMRDRIYVAAILSTTLLGFVFIMLIYAFPLRLQVVNAKSSLVAGVMLLPLLGGSAAGSTTAGAVNSKANWMCETLVVASSLMTLGCGLLSTLSGALEIEAKALGFLVFVGFGFGLSAAASTMLATTQASIPDQAPAQGVLAQMRILGGSIGIAASSAVLAQTLRSQLAGVADPRQLASLEHHAHGFTESQMTAVREAYAGAFQEEMRVCAAVAGVGIVAALAAWSRDRTSLSDRRDQSVREEAEKRKRASGAE